MIESPKGISDSENPKALSRRDFLRLVKMTGLSAVLVACGVSTDIPTPDVNPSAPPLKPPAEATPPPTPIPEPTGTPVAYSTEVPPGVVYGPPSLADAKFLEGSGGGGRDDILAQTGMTDAQLEVFENAAYDGAKHSGYSKEQLNIIYKFDKAHLQWNMVLRLADGGYLWAQNVTDGTFSTFPLQIPYGAGGIAWNPDYKLVVVPDSEDAEFIFTSGGSVVLKGGPKEKIYERTFYSLWFNTVSGVWEAIPKVKEAMAAAAKIRYLPELIGEPWKHTDRIPVITTGDLPKLREQVLAEKKWFPDGSPVIGAITIQTPSGNGNALIYAPSGSLRVAGMVRAEIATSPIIVILVYNTTAGPATMFDVAYSQEVPAPEYIGRLREFINPDGTFSKEYTISYNLWMNPDGQKKYPRKQSVFSSPEYAGVIELFNEAVTTGVIPQQIQELLMFCAGVQMN